MMELKRLNVHRIVETQEEANKLISDGFKVVRENPAGKTPPEKPAKAKG